MKTSPEFILLSLETPDGEFVAHYSTAGLAALNFPTNPECAGRAPENGIDARMAAWHQLTITAVKNVLAGRAAGPLPPLDLSAGTEFQRAVWQAMLRIPSGRTRSYGELAAEIGNPQAVRAVGGACGANPIPVLVPCHRVLAAGGKIGGFSGGLDWKRKLLAREGVIFG